MIIIHRPYLCDVIRNKSKIVNRCTNKQTAIANVFKLACFATFMNRFGGISDTAELHSLILVVMRLTCIQGHRLLAN